MAENSGSRLVDYFAVIGFDDKSERNGVSVGKIIQRFPEVDWLDVPFFQGLELFCQPQEWRICTKPQSPTFFISVLTDIGADRHYVACLSFSEARFGSENPALLNDDECSAAAELASEQESSISATDSPLHTTKSSSITTGSAAQSPIMYCPKCLVLVSRHPYFEAFRNCLGTIYTVYIDKLSVEMELLVGNLVSGVQINPPGGNLLKFSLGAGDHQSVQPPSTPTIPVTNSTVAILLQHLGISNVICLFSAVLTDKKILFYSQSYTRLLDACHGLSSLLYPLKYKYPYIPILPGSLVEVLQSPTPFIMGLHVSYKSQLLDLTEVICVDFDNGSVFVPPDSTNTVPPLPPEPYLSRLQTCLTLVLNKDLFTADYAFGAIITNPANGGKSAATPLHVIDKQIRACFLRLFADLFSDYRSCLKIVRIYPKPFLTFHKAAFLSTRGFQDDEFMNRLIDSMSFQSYVMERGVPYRVCDLFDEVYANILKIVHEEGDDRDKMYENIQQLAQQLLNNESPNQSLVNKVPTPSADSALILNPSSSSSSSLIASRLSQPFSLLDPNRVQAVIDEHLTKLYRQQESSSPTSPAISWNRALQPREVPDTPKPVKYLIKSSSKLITGNVRRLEVLKNCLKCIFENKISDARKMVSAVLLSMKSNVVRVAFCQELCSYLRTQNKASVEPQQFDMLVRLMNCALQNDSASDEYGVAYALLSLATAYCRRLSTGVVQFAYTCVQDHPVWQNQQFWEAAFYHDVHLQLRDLYTAPQESRKSSSAVYGIMPSRDTWNRYEEPCALKIAAEKLRAASRLSKNDLQELAKNEQAIIFSQAIHYANRVVYFRVPMDANKLRRVNIRNLEESSSCASVSVSNVSSVENGSGDSTTDSDLESGYADGGTDANGGAGGAGGNDLGQGTVRWISKFLDKICSEAGLPADKMRQLHQMIPGVVAMHIETIENVHRESKKLPPIHKPRMVVPSFLPNEQMRQGYLRVYLLPDGRQDSSKVAEKAHDNCLLPAEGAIFMTNYRIIFKGQPCDPYICEKVVMRVIPVMSVTKFKRIGQQYMSSPDQATHYFHDALQIRSATFQMMKIAFDEEVGQEKVQTFFQALEQSRWPESLFDTFALSWPSCAPAGLLADKMAQQKGKSGTIKGFAKKTLLRTAQKAGFGRQGTTKGGAGPMELTFSGTTTTTAGAARSPSGLPRNAQHHTLPSPTRRGTLTAADGTIVTPGDVTAVDRSPGDKSNPVFTRTLDRLADRSYCKDYQRLGLCTRSEVTLHSGNQQTGATTSTSSASSSIAPSLVVAGGSGQFRLSTVNRVYSVCKTYPVVVVVPAKISDDSVKKIAKGHKHSRFPVVTWRSDRGALLLRGASFQTRAWNPWKQQQQQQTPADIPAGSAAGRLRPASSSQLQQQQQQHQTGLKSSVEQERYFNCMVSLSPGPPPMTLSTGRGFGSLLSLDEHLLWNMDAMSMSSCSHSTYNTPDMGRKPQLSHSGLAGQQTGGGGSTVGSTVAGQLHKFAAIRNSGGKSMGPRLGLRMGAGKTSTLGVSSRTPSMLSAPRRLSVASDSGSQSFSRVSGSQSLQRASLYIFGEKNQAKIMKLDPKCEFIPVDFPDSHSAKEALKKFLRATAPSAPPASETGAGSFLKSVDESGWLQQVQSLLQIAGAIVDIIDLQNSSVCVCLEYGWDATSQIVSLAQIMLDPYYRTLDGFRTLVEKEWLSFGHRFSHRYNHTVDSSTSGVAPIFLLFLDAVQQIYQQYPGAFEFNPFYLGFLAYHSSSAYFRTFLMDSEADRVQSGVLQFDSKPRPRPEMYGHQYVYQQEEMTMTMMTRNQGQPPGSGPGSTAPSAGQQQFFGSIWDYVMEKHQRSARFYNFLYTPGGKHVVLRPQVGLSSLCVWDWFTDDPLSIGSPYDIDAAEMELQERQADRPYQQQQQVLVPPGATADPGPGQAAATPAGPHHQPQSAPSSSIVGSATGDRKVVDLKYDSADYSPAGGGNVVILESLLEAIRDLERDLDVLPQKWPVVLTKLCQRLERDEEESAQIGAAVEWARWLSRTLHKKATIELLLRGRLLSRGGGPSAGIGGFGGSGQSISDQQYHNQNRLSFLETSSSTSGGGTHQHHHRFQKYNPTAPEHCHVCNRLLWSVVRQGLRCSACEFSCHEKCASMTMASCPGAPMSRAEAAGLSSASGGVGGGRQQGQVVPAVESGRRYAGGGSDISGGGSAIGGVALDDFETSPLETRTYEGYLMKRGALLKAWKQRWFVLDSMKHELRYLDAREDPVCKGRVDLAEVIGIGPASAPAGTPRHLEGAFFDLKTIRRVYNFMATSQSEAHAWIEKIQACL